MLTLYTFAKSFNEPSHSPYCVKAMILLEMSKQPWQRKDLATPNSMPHKKLPVVKAGDKIIADSEFIQDWLSEQGADFYADCSDEQKAMGHAITRMAEASLALALVYDRWLDEACWEITAPLFFEKVPRLIRKIIAGKIQKNVRKTLTSNGFARLSSDERLKKINRDLNTIETVLGSKKYILGDHPTAVDASVLPILSMIERTPAQTETRTLLRSKTGLMKYIQNGRETLYHGLV